MAEELPLSEPLPLSAAHDLSGFDCGALALNDYLRKYAYANQQANAARTYVTVRGNQVAGYYTLAAGAVRREETTGRVSTGLARHPVPIILLARLAIDLNEQGKGIGVALLKDALLRSARAADLIGCRAVLVHAKDAAAKAFYMRFGFEPSPTDELHLYMLMKDIKANLAGS